MKKYVLWSMAAACCLTACQNDDFVEPASETYTKEFVKTFGVIDSQQDWNLATRKSVKVNPGSSSSAKVYANIDGRYKLVANYSGLTGETELGFDVPASVTDLVVVVGNQALTTKAGSSVSFANVVRADASSEITVTYLDTDVLEFSQSRATSLITTLPEDENMTGADNRTAAANAGFAQNFEYASTGGFLLYPVYWNTAATVTVGVCYEVNGEQVYQDIYTIRDGNRLQYCVSAGQTVTLTQSELQAAIPSLGNPQSGGWLYTYNYWSSAQQNLIRAYVEETYGSSASCTFINRSTQVSVDYTSDSWKPVPSKGYNDGGEAAQYPSTYGTGSSNFRSYPIKVEIPKGLVVKFYVKQTVNGTDYYVYSDASMNKNGNSYAVTRTNTDSESGLTYRELAFEDWPDNEKIDLNDVIFDILPISVTDPEPPIIENETYDWIIAAEDLGGTDDFDFNDIVFKVTYTSGETTATVTPLAAGGMLEAYILRDGEQVGDEVHSMFGVPTTTMYNTTSWNGAADPIEITVPEDFTMTTDGEVSAMGGFTVKVVKESGETTNVTAPGRGDAPQMICVPSSWQWPIERTNISDAYNSFGDWGANYGKNTDWYNVRVSGKTVSR